MRCGRAEALPYISASSAWGRAPSTGGQAESRPYGDGGKRRGSVEAAEGVLQTLEAGLAAQELHRLEEGWGGRATGDGDA